MSDPAIIEELTRIADRNGGLLLAEHVVKAARSPKSVLHSRFEWDDSAAAEQWRLEQARKLIRICVIIEPRINKPIRAWVSLMPDREEDGGGYRRLATVLTDEQLRQQLIQDALVDMKTFETKYNTLKELAGLFKEIRKTRRKLEDAADGAGAAAGAPN